MLQTLFYIPPQFFGVPIFGIGWLFGILLVGTAVALLVPCLRQKTSVASTLAAAAVIAALLVFVFPNLAEHGNGTPIRGYGLCLLTAVLVSLALVVRLAKKRNIPTESVYSLCIWAVVSGIVGARIFYVTEYWQDIICFDNADHLLLPDTLFNIANIAGGGLVVFGSILGGIIGSAVFIRRNKLPFFASFDAMAPALMLGISIGRIGCFLNGCCFGGVCDLPWAVTFPADSPAHIHQIVHGDVFCGGLKFKETDGALTISEVQHGSGAAQAGLKSGMAIRSIAAVAGEYSGRLTVWQVRSVSELTALLRYLYRFYPKENVRFDICMNPEQTETQPYYVPVMPPQVLPVHPTQLYSSAAALAVCGILLVLGSLPLYRRRDGLVFATFLILYAAVRFVLEIIRTDEDSFLGTGLTVSQNICLAAGAVGIIFFIFILRRKSKFPKNSLDIIRE
ncbi:MAG: prolipoprotein diacylglyceryl transferase [Planctomycetaceae bacterium]|jgi:phosphatidylglycerol:prolipoprotein diacylglycerol transferase|nr:prolipoprotein diacylglyceryl transferase [Planctomycetaceae bacterium]